MRNPCSIVLTRIINEQCYFAYSAQSLSESTLNTNIRYYLYKVIYSNKAVEIAILNFHDKPESEVVLLYHKIPTNLKGF